MVAPKPSLNRKIGFIVAGSALLLVPCFWQSRIQAGDLSSHLYNAWLTQLIERGQAPGLAIVGQTHNILFDLMLGGLMSAFGPGPAQRVAVSIAVLIFFWGAFAFVFSSGLRPGCRTPLHLLPCLAMLAYGWVYHMGLFNFYMSLGFVLGALTVAQRRERWRWAAVAVLLALAYTAHALPFVWGAAAIGYMKIAYNTAFPRRLWLLGGSVAGVFLVSLMVRCLYVCALSPDQKFAFTGADQIWTFGPRYLFLAGVVLALWLLWLRHARWHDPRLHLLIVTAACILLIPGVIVLPSSGQAESLVVGRMSLAMAVLICALAASGPPRKALAGIMAVAAAVFFVFIYQDELALNRVEDKVEQAVAHVPPGSRAVSALMDSQHRVFAVLHMIDRACVGRCYSYANYEPSVNQFRIRAQHENDIVVANFRESWAIQAGGYVVKPRDLPLYRIDVCDASQRDLCVAVVPAGVKLKPTVMAGASL